MMHLLQTACLLSAAFPAAVVAAAVPPIPATTSWFNGAWGVTPRFFTPRAIQGKTLLIVDLDGVSASQIADWRAQGHIVQCYISVGTMEEFREDVKANLAEWRGASLGVMQDWPDERWLDLRQLDKLKALQGPRFQRAKDKGCQALEPDNVDCYDNADCKNRMPNLTRAQARALQVEYNTWQIETAHGLGMAISLKNAMDLVQDMHDAYDFAVNEQCFQYKECGLYKDTFIKQNKAVFVHQYGLRPKNMCKQGKALGLQVARCATRNGNTCKGNWKFC